MRCCGSPASSQQANERTVSRLPGFDLRLNYQWKAREVEVPTYKDGKDSAWQMNSPVGMPHPIEAYPNRA